MTVDVRYELKGARGVFLSEAALEDATLEHDQFRELQWTGAIMISTSGQPELRIEDEVWHQLMHLCRSARDLFAGEAAGVPYSEIPGGYELVPIGDHVTVAGDHLNESRFEIEPLTRAILACANRFVVLMRRLGYPEVLGVAVPVTSEATALGDALRVRAERPR